MLFPIPTTRFFQSTRTTHFLFSYSFCRNITTPSNSSFCYIGIDIADRINAYSVFLKQCSHFPHGKAIHAQLIKTSFISSLFLQNFLLQMYAKSRDFGSALKVFDEMPERNSVSWASLIAGFVQGGRPTEALFFFSRMYREEVKPSEFAIVSALNACSLMDYSCQAHQLYGLVVRLGFEWNVFVVNAFVTTLIRNDQFSDAVKAFDECSVRDIVSWNTMMNGYLQHSVLEVPRFWLRMVREGVRPDEYSFSTVLSGMVDIGDHRFGVQVHGQLLKYGHGSETCVGNALVDMYLKFRDLGDGYKAFLGIPDKNVVSWTTMATGFVNCGAPSKALEFFREMRMAGLTPNQFSLATVFNACANLASLEEGRKAHGLRIKLGDGMDVCTDNALLDMYVKCGCMDESLNLFRRMKEHTIVSWTSMVMGFARNGQPTEALGIFKEMVAKGIEPNYITFLCVLYACSQGGLVEQGWKYFNSMTHRYGIQPGEDHYACMVDLLGRAGHIKEAEELISKMPCHPGQLIWQTLLAACHIHGDVEAGNRAAKHAMQLNQDGPATYVLISNMLAGLNHWEGAHAMRSIMHDRNANKTPGTSSI